MLAGLTVAMSLVATFVIRETGPGRGGGARSQAASSARAPHLGTILLRPGFTAYALVKTFGFMALMGYIAASPFIFQEYIGADELGGAALFALNSLALIVANALNARLVRRHGPARMMRVGLLLLTTAAVALALVVFLGAPPWALIPTFVLLVGSMGLIFGNSIALAISHARDAAGSASAFIGFAQFVAGAAVAPLVGVAGRISPVPLTVVVVVATVGAWACALVGARAPADPS